MKILLTTDNPTSAVNGVVFSTLSLRKGLAERGHDVRILALSSNGKSYYKDGIWYTSSFPADVFYPGMRVGMIPLKIRCEIREWCPDIIHTQNEFILFLYAKKTARKQGIPHVHTFHTKYDDYLEYFPTRFIGRAVINFCCGHLLSGLDRIIVPSDKMKAFLREHRCRSPLTSVPSGIDRDFFFKESDSGEIRKKLGIPENRRMLLSVSRVAGEKKLDALIDYVLNYNESDAVLVIAGDGPLYGELTKKVKKLGAQNKILFTGFVPHDELRYYYSAADIFVCASDTEAQGLTYYEAICCGLPILCRYDSCFDGMLCDGECGYFFRNGREFKERLSEMLCDGALLDGMRDRALEKSEQFSREVFAERIEKIYIAETEKRK